MSRTRLIILAALLLAALLGLGVRQQIRLAILALPKLTLPASVLPVPAPAPLLGEHTEEVLADVAGLSSARIGKLFDDGVVAGPRPLRSGA